MSPQASASLRLFTRPAWSTPAATACGTWRRGNTSVSRGARSSPSWWRSCSSRTWPAVSRTKSGRDRQGNQGNAGSARDEHVARGEVCGKPSAERRRDGDAAVAGRLVEPEGQAAALWADEVDLHDDGHRPGQPLVDAEQGVGGDDPGPARRDRDQQRHGQRDRPAEDQQPSAPEPLGADPGGEVGERLGEAEGDDERQDRRARREPEVGLADERQGRALEPDHRADERVDGDEQRELGEVLAEAKPDCRTACQVGYALARFRA